MTTKPGAVYLETKIAKQTPNPNRANTDPRNPPIPSNFRFIYPEFLPDPKIEFRNPIREKLERFDMLNRRYIQNCSTH